MGVGVLSGMLLAIMLVAIMLVAMISGARRLGSEREDEIAIAFCGSNKSLAPGAPIIGALFPAAAVGGVIRPLVFFHQIQLAVSC